jgi:hypothetical protein
LPLLVDSSLYEAGAPLNNVTVSGPWQLIVEPVVWKNAVNVAVSGNSLTRTGAPGWNAGASSTKQLSGNGYVEFTAGPAGSHRILGLGNGDTGQSYSDVAFGFLLADTGVLTIYESGNFRGYFGTYSPADRLRVAVESGSVRYYRNGVLLHTSASSPTFPLLVDSSLYETGAPLNNVTVSGVWQ